MWLSTTGLISFVKEGKAYVLDSSGDCFGGHSLRKARNTLPSIRFSAVISPSICIIYTIAHTVS